MTHWKRVVLTIGAVVTFVAMGLSLPPGAEARGRRGFYGPAFVGGFYGWGSYWGVGLGPFFGPYYPFDQPPGGVDLGYAMMARVGAVDLDVKPSQAEVWVDGKFVAEARDLDGYPSYLWLKEGSHHLVVYKGGYRRFEEDVDVLVAMKTELKVRLEKGDSEPPGERPAAGAVSAGHRHEPGDVRLRVRPDDASVYVDGEFRGSGQELKGLRLAPGRHRIEIARPGFRTLERDVEVEAGHTVDLDVEMERP